MPLEPSPGLHPGPAVEITVPLGPYQHLWLILSSFFTKYNIRKLNLLSKMDISKIASVNLRSRKQEMFDHASYKHKPNL